jgi:hypothetical protein
MTKENHMGSTTFIQERNSEKTAAEAFRAAVEEARHNYGHAGYTGTIAEQNDFILLPPVEGKNAWDTAWHYLDNDPRVDDKWGPAGCIQTDTGFVFFGWASC